MHDVPALRLRDAVKSHDITRVLQLVRSILIFAVLPVKSRVDDIRACTEITAYC